MAGLLIIAHAPLASSLKAVGAHVYPELAVVEALDVQSGQAPEDVEPQALALLANVRDPEALILTDVFGATPCNVALRIANGVQVRVVTGVNVPMLWRALCYRGEGIEAIVTRALAGATQGVMQVAVSRPQNQAIKSTGNDQVSHHHQQ